MFVRRNRNRSGSTSIQIIDKSGGQYKILQTIGVTKNPRQADLFADQARAIIQRIISENQLELLSLKSKQTFILEHFLQNLTNNSLQVIGPELIFGALFDSIGFNIIPDILFRHLVITRLVYPTSKVKTVDYLKRYQDKEISVDQIYRFLDDLQSKHKTTVERVTYNYTKNILNNISVVFYDMTTLYFETEDEDDLRKIGFSKDGKFQCPQIMIGLLVGEHGLPIGYDIFEGNTFEGHTLIPILKKIQKKYGFPKPIVIADAALLSKSNLSNLADQKYRFIIGARIKNEGDKVRAKILAKAVNLRDGDYFNIKRPDGTRLVITYSKKRAKKDVYNRKKGLRKLRKKISSGKLTKQHINNRGYNKFLTLGGNVTVQLNEDMIEQDKRWDGLKGYVTNTNMWGKTIVSNYQHLWQIETAFRISKTDLRIRPVHHRKVDRIEAHICISFVAYTIYKELERLLHKYAVGMSVKRAIELTHTMYQLTCTLPGELLPKSFQFKMSTEQQKVIDMIQNISG